MSYESSPTWPDFRGIDAIKILVLLISKSRSAATRCTAKTEEKHNEWSTKRSTNMKHAHRISQFRDCLLLLMAALTAVPAYATFPGRNGLIAFQADTDSGTQIFTVRPNGQDLRQITFVSDNAVTPDWSPDGQQIVFEIDRGDPSSCGAGIAIMNADGSNLVELTSNHTVCDFDPSFTPDGSRIVFDRFDPATGEETIWSMERNGNCCLDPNVSPNGKKLSFLRSTDVEGQSALFTSAIDGSNLFQVTPFSFNVAIKQDWAPDGRHLVFTKDGDVLMPGISANIATIRPDGTHLRLLTHLRRWRRQRVRRLLLPRRSMDCVSTQ
jgi:Tol biopolymer transport system component